jgi:hypothetical protein
MRIFFTGAEARKSGVPFLLDASMQPITAANAWLQELAQDGATSSPCSWKTYAYHLFDYFSYPDTDLLAHLGAAREQEVPAVTFERLAQPKIRWRPQREIMQWLNSIEDWRDKLIAKLRN